MVDAIGWAELYAGDLIGAAFVMYDSSFVGWTVAILFFVYQFMLYMKTRNLVITWTMGIIFVAAYAGLGVAVTQSGYFLLKMISLQIMFLILAVELGAILYDIFWK